MADGDIYYRVTVECPGLPAAQEYRAVLTIIEPDSSKDVIYWRNDTVVLDETMVPRALTLLVDMIMEMLG